MFDEMLGEYAFTVLLAYGGALFMLAALLALSFVQARRVHRRLSEIEARRKS